VCLHQEATSAPKHLAPKHLAPKQTLSRAIFFWLADAAFFMTNDLFGCVLSLFAR